MGNPSNLPMAMPIIIGNYARKFGVQVRMQGCSAYTNGHIITLPRLDMSDQVVARKAYGYLAHESAHVRYTSFRTLARYRSDFTVYTVINILEDARVERLIGREFVGVWENLALIRDDPVAWNRYVSSLEEMDDLQIVLGFLIPYLASHVQKFPGQRPRAAMLLRRLRHTFRHKAVRKLCHLALEVRNTKSTNEVGKLAMRIVELLGSDEFFGTRHLVDNPPGSKELDLLNSDERDSQSDDERNRAESIEQDAAFKRRRAELLAKLSGKLDRIAPGCYFTSMIEQSICAGAGSRDDFGSFTYGQARPGRADFLDNLPGISRMVNNLRRKVLAFDSQDHFSDIL